MLLTIEWVLYIYIYTVHACINERIQSHPDHPGWPPRRAFHVDQYKLVIRDDQLFHQMNEWISPIIFEIKAHMPSSELKVMRWNHISDQHECLNDCSTYSWTSTASIILQPMVLRMVLVRARASKTQTFLFRQLRSGWNHTILKLWSWYWHITKVFFLKEISLKHLFNFTVQDRSLCFLNFFYDALGLYFVHQECVLNHMLIWHSPALPGHMSNEVFRHAAIPQARVHTHTSQPASLDSTKLCPIWSKACAFGTIAKSVRPCT